MHLKHSEYMRQSVRVSEIHTCGQKATAFAVPFAVADGSIASFSRGVRKRGCPLRASSAVGCGSPQARKLTSRSRRTREFPIFFGMQAIPGAADTLETEGRANLLSTHGGCVDLVGSARPYRLAAGTRDLRYRYSPPNPVCYSLAVLAFLRMGPARQRPRDPALRRRSCCGVFCAAGPRRRL